MWGGRSTQSASPLSQLSHAHTFNQLLADVSVVRERVVQNNDYHRSNRRRSSKASDHDDKNNTSSSSACTSPSNSTLKVAEVLVRKTVIDQQHFLEIKVILIGGADAGKSTFIGVMTHSDLDNGRGKSRLNALRHRHEIESGRTSSISHQIIGFSQSGELINYATTHVTAWEHICETASKVVSFFDTCGHPKYQHTTIRGLTGQSPDYSCLIVNGGLGYIPDTSKEHMRISLAIKVPVFIIITKIDVATAEELTHTLESLMSFLKSPGITMTPVVIQNEDDVLTSISNFTSLW